MAGTLTVSNSSTANPGLTASLTGTGLPTTATFTPVTASYANTVVGSTSSALAFVWTNTSSIPLTVSKVSTSSDFAVSSTTCTGAVAANASCAVAVVFTPTVLGARTGSVTVTSTSSANGSLTATLSGRGVADVESSPSLVSFGNADVGTSAMPQSITLTNYTNASIALTSLSITGDFSYTSACGAAIAGLSTCTITLGFTPTAVGIRNGNLTVNTNDTKYPVITVALTGNGVDFSIAVSPTAGSVIAGLPVSLNVTLTPLGGFSAPITMTCKTTASGSTCTPAQAALTLSAATTDAVAITTTSQYTVIGYTGLGLGPRPWALLLSMLSAGMVLMRRRRRLLPRLLAVLLVLGAVGITNIGCSGRLPDANSNPTLPGAYPYTFTATDGTLTHTATYTLTVSAN